MPVKCLEKVKTVMFEVIKGSSPANTIIIEGDVKIATSSPKKAEEESSVEEAATENKEEEKNGGLITMTQEELDSLRAQYRMDGEQ